MIEDDICFVNDVDDVDEVVRLVDIVVLAAALPDPNDDCTDND